MNDASKSARAEPLGARSEDSERICTALRSGSTEAIAEVRARVGRILRARSYGIPAAEREELEQEIVIQIWQAVNRTRFDPTRGFWGFVEVVSARRCIDWLRAKRRAAGRAVVDPVEERRAIQPLGEALAHERAQLAFAALAQLGKPCRDLIYLRIGMGRSYREIGQLLGRSEGALRVQMHRCICDARRILSELSETEETG